ncbi:MAG: hypothetical protein Pg6A_02010 [Termitinemataceae bacterium]|nr:MAG: hypothetical protein Pg6A_02010 [Termitinemataceae bacterium]
MAYYSIQNQVTIVTITLTAILRKKIREYAEANSKGK